MNNKYRVENVLPQNLEAFRNLPCARAFSDECYQPPSPEEVDQLIKLAGWSQKDCAKLTGVSFTDKGSSTVRRWKTSNPKDHREIKYSAWRLLLLYANVVTLENGLKELDYFKNLRN